VRAILALERAKQQIADKEDELPVSAGLSAAGGCELDLKSPFKPRDASSRTNPSSGKIRQASSFLPTRDMSREFILGDFLIGLSTASADSDSNSESVGYLNLIDALTPTLVWFNFFHLEGLPV
jgi:hypothetical protein